MRSTLRSLLTFRHPRADGAPSRAGVLAAGTAAIGGLVVLGAVPASSVQPEDNLEVEDLEDLDGLGSDAAESVAVALSAVPAEDRADLDAVAEVFAERDLSHLFEWSQAYVASDGEVIDAERVGAWLESRDSPMAPHAEELVAAGIAHEVDPRLVVGIAAIESEAGKRLPPGSHNAWGWNGSGPHGLQAWPSWSVAIDEFTEGLARVYDTDNVDETMAQKYVPPNWEHWLSTVRWVIDDI